MRGMEFRWKFSEKCVRILLILRKLKIRESGAVSRMSVWDVTWSNFNRWKRFFKLKDPLNRKQQAANKPLAISSY